MLGNTLKTWEHFENMLGTHWEQGRKTKKNSPHPTPPHPEKEKTGPIVSVWLSLPIGCMQFLFPKLFVTIFLARANGRGRNLATEGTYWQLYGNPLGT